MGVSDTALCHTSGDESHLCIFAKVKISLKAHRHAHGVGTPIARPENLIQQ